MYINLFQYMCEGSNTSAKSVCGGTEDFNIEVGVYQGSALSPCSLW